MSVRTLLGTASPLRSGSPNNVLRARPAENLAFELEADLMSRDSFPNLFPAPSLIFGIVIGPGRETETRPFLEETALVSTVAFGPLSIDLRDL